VRVACAPLLFESGYLAQIFAASFPVAFEELVSLAAENLQTSFGKGFAASTGQFPDLDRNFHEPVFLRVIAE